jgi:phospholipid/cholesterol/gamma-HCH transport system ATP-binding protein
VIRVVGIRKRYGRREVLRDVTLEVPDGQVFGLIGPGASGKSVLTKTFCGLVKIDTGVVEVDGQDISQMSEIALHGIRSRFGMQFQNNALFTHLTVTENIAFPLRRMTDLNDAEIGKQVEERLERVGLPGFGDRMPDELSGGQKKRVGVARATISRAPYTIYDEPTAGLDPVTSQKIFDLLRDEQREQRNTVIMISSDVAGLLTVLDRVGMMLKGRLIFEGSVDEARSALQPEVKQFIHGEIEGPL